MDSYGEMKAEGEARMPGKTSGTHATQPFEFDADVVKHLEIKASEIQTRLAGKWAINVMIDEIALMFPTDEMASRYVSGALLEDSGLVHFNAAYDSVLTAPIQSSYRVRYDFLKNPAKDWIRLECMVIQSGVSPLHAALSPMIGDRPVPVHASFKCYNEADYDRSVRQLEEAGFVLAQECRSTYGQFSYWWSSEFNIYIKPRVNLRDA